LGAGVYVRDMDLSASRLKDITFETMNNKSIQLEASKLGQTFVNESGIAKGVDKLMGYVAALSF
jgi:hypothetical protein